MREHARVDGGEDAGSEAKGGESERCRVSNFREDGARHIYGLRHVEVDSCSGLEILSDAATILHGHVWGWVIFVATA